MRGHEEASGVKYVPQNCLNCGKKRPRKTLRRILLSENILCAANRTNKAETKTYIESELNIAYNASRHTTKHCRS